MLFRSSKINELEQILENLQTNLSNVESIIEQITDKNIQLSTKNSTVTLINTQIDDLRKEIESSKANTADVDVEKTKLKQLAQEALDKIKSKNELGEVRNIEDAANILLKDTGIKTAIIREYLPIMNKLINKYLNAMDA